MTDKYKYIYGPVPSRRLGLSLGVDIVPLKSCTQNCIYCQLCVDAPQMTERAEYIPVEDVLKELKRKLQSHPAIDCITLSGSGEPTLNSGLGRLLKGIKSISDSMLVVITNGTLLWREDVRRELMDADAVMPSLDACDQETFEKINRPASEITFDKHIEGLKKFREEFTGKIWLEMFMVDGLNTAPEQLAKFKTLIAQIRPDKVQLNTAVRPTTAMEIGSISQKQLQEIAKQLDNGAEIIAKFTKRADSKSAESLIERVMDTLKRRPCSIEGISSSLGISEDQTKQQLELLLKKNIVRTEKRGDELFYIII